MTAIFAKQKGHWKFYAFLSSDDQIKSEMNHLKEQGVHAIQQPMRSLDVDKIQEIESSLNV